MIKKKLFNILRETFPGAQLPDEYKLLQLGDFAEWDSIGNFNLLLAVEDNFEIRFTVDQMSEIKSTDQIISALKKAGCDS